MLYIFLYIANPVIAVFVNAQLFDIIMPFCPVQSAEDVTNPHSHVLWFICVMQIALYSISFGFGWGPVGWLVPSEIHDLNTRSAGQSITVFTQLVSGATVTQSKLPGLAATLPRTAASFSAFCFGLPVPFGVLLSEAIECCHE